MTAEACWGNPIARGAALSLKYMKSSAQYPLYSVHLIHLFTFSFGISGLRADRRSFVNLSSPSPDWLAQACAYDASVSPQTDFAFRQPSAARSKLIAEVSRRPQLCFYDLAFSFFRFPAREFCLTRPTWRVRLHAGARRAVSTSRRFGFRGIPSQPRRPSCPAARAPDPVGAGDPAPRTTPSATRFPIHPAILPPRSRTPAVERAPASPPSPSLSAPGSRSGLRH